MKKLLLIPFLMLFAVASASAHCGTCGTEKSAKKDGSACEEKKECDGSGDKKADADKPKDSAASE